MTQLRGSLQQAEQELREARRELQGLHAQVSLTPGDPQEN